MIEYVTQIFSVVRVAELKAVDVTVSDNFDVVIDKKGNTSLRVCDMVYFFSLFFFFPFFNV